MCTLPTYTFAYPPYAMHSLTHILAYHTLAHWCNRTSAQLPSHELLVRWYVLCVYVCVYVICVLCVCVLMCMCEPSCMARARVVRARARARARVHRPFMQSRVLSIHSLAHTCIPSHALTHPCFLPGNLQSSPLLGLSYEVTGTHADGMSAV